MKSLHTNAGIVVESDALIGSCRGLPFILVLYKYSVLKVAPALSLIVVLVGLSPKCVGTNVRL